MTVRDLQEILKLATAPENEVFVLDAEGSALSISRLSFETDMEDNSISINIYVSETLA